MMEREEAINGMQRYVSRLKRERGRSGESGERGELEEFAAIRTSRSPKGVLRRALTSHLAAGSNDLEDVAAPEYDEYVE